MSLRLLLFLTLVWLPTGSEGVILYRTGDPNANTTAPTGSLAGSGWQFEGTFGGFLGTPIAPHHFITAEHIGVPAQTFSFRGANYTIVRWFDDPATDLRIFEVAEAFPVFAPLYTGNNEVGRHLVVIGRGTRRGPEMIFNGQARGWEWGSSDLVQRWGENVVASITPSPNGDLLYARFDRDGLPQEAHLSSGDSGGAVFVDDNGVWKLAGINYDVDRFYSGTGGGGPFDAALYDTRGRYRRDGSIISGDALVPSGFYASRISSKLTWINSIIKPRLANIAARASVRSDDEVCIAGFIISNDGGQSKRVVLRGLGPSLQVGGVPISGRLDDPMLELHDASGATLLTNNNWRDSQSGEIQASGLAPPNPAEAAIIATLPAGAYTAVLRSANTRTGAGLVEVYDIEDRAQARLINLSARASVGTGDEVLIGGLIVNSVSSRVLLRALGGELATNGVRGVLLNPTLELRDANGMLISFNDNWIDAANAAEIMATQLAPADARESALLVRTGSATCTAIVRGVGNTTGIALLEFYLLD